MTKHYLPKVLLTILLVFSLIFFIISIICKASAFNPNFYVKHSASANFILGNIQTDLENYSHESGIETDELNSLIDLDSVKNIRDDNIKAAFDFINSKLDSYSYANEFEYDFSALEKYFSSEAKKHGISEDSDEYKEALSSAESNINKLIIDNCDVYKFSAMNKIGLLAKFQKLAKFSNIGIWVSLVAFIIFFLAIILISGPANSIYWISTSFVVSGAIIFIPSIYLRVSGILSKINIRNAAFIKSVESSGNSILNILLIVSTIIILVFLGLLILDSKIGFKFLKKDLNNKSKS